MSVILTLTATGNGVLTSMTSGIALTDIMIGIIGAALLVSLVVTYLLSSREGESKNAAEAVLGINVTLLITFCIFVAFKAAELL